jgi:hypothetical protein
MKEKRVRLNLDIGRKTASQLSREEQTLEKRKLVDFNEVAAKLAKNRDASIEHLTLKEK